MLPLRAFEGAEHEPFRLVGGEAAALLVHGYPGTPAEMSGLAAALHGAGWTVDVPLLPGFGKQISTLADRRYTDWLDHVREALAALKRDHGPVLLVGHSMGGALALAVSAELPPDGLVLLAPFWQIDNLIWHLLPVIKRVVPQFRPFRLLKPNFADPQMREGIHNFWPDADLDDPQVQQAVRELKVPVSLFDELRALGQLAARAAETVRVPTLVVQGTGDTLVKPAITRKLVAKLPAARYLEVDAAHDLPTTAPAREAVFRAILEYARALVPA
jgi:carboxylesterase